MIFLSWLLQWNVKCLEKFAVTGQTHDCGFLCWACKSTQKWWVLPVLWCLLLSLSSRFEFLQVPSLKVLLRVAYWWYGATESVLQPQEAFENSLLISSLWTSLLVAQTWSFGSSSKESVPLPDGILCFKFSHHTLCSDCWCIPALCFSDTANWGNDALVYM